MDRRAFFTRGADKAAQALAKHAAKKARENASRWIRPPFAIEELDFLLACNRCGDCIEACPHDVIFPLSSKLGVKVFSTPAMDLFNHSCHLCEDWPCVEVCEKEALKVIVSSDENNTEEHVLENSDIENVNREEVNEDSASRVLPKIATVYINTQSCMPYSGPECGACRVCPVEGAMLWDMEKPSINMQLCTGCALCREACIVEPKAIIVQSKYK